jgi:hypothetical protein
LQGAAFFAIASIHGTDYFLKIDLNGEIDLPFGYGNLHQSFGACQWTVGQLHGGCLDAKPHPIRPLRTQNRIG